MKLFVVGLVLLTIVGLAACGDTTASQSDGSKNDRSTSYYYTADEGGGSISKIDAATNTFVKRIKVGGPVHNVQVSPDGKTVGATVMPETGGHDHGNGEEEGYDHGHTQTKGGAYFYDTATDELVKQVEVGAHPAPAHLAIQGRVKPLRHNAPHCSTPTAIFYPPTATTASVFTPIFYQVPT